MSSSLMDSGKSNKDDVLVLELMKNEDEVEAQESTPLINSKNTNRDTVYKYSNSDQPLSLQSNDYIDKMMNAPKKKQNITFFQKLLEGSAKTKLIKFIALAPFYLLLLGLIIFLIIKHMSPLNPAQLGTFGKFAKNTLSLNITNCLVYITDKDSIDGSTGIAKIQRPHPWKWNSGFVQEFSQANGDFNVLIQNPYSIEYCNLSLFIEPTNPPAGFSLTCDGCAVVQDSEKFIVGGPTTITGNQIYINMANFQTKSMQFTGQQGLFQINMINIDNANTVNTIAFSDKGDIIIQSDKNIEIDKFTSPTQTFCFAAPSVNIQTTDCAVSGQANTDNESGNKACTGSGTLATANNGVAKQIYDLSTASGNIYVNIISGAMIPVSKTSKTFYSQIYDQGINIDNETDTEITNFLKLANSSTVNDPILILNFGNQNSYSAASSTWIIASNPAYESIKPWAISTISGGLLKAYDVQVSGQLLPGFCPWRPTLNTKDLSAISTFLNTKKGSLTSNVIFIWDEDPTAQELQNYQQSTGVQAPDDTWIPWNDYWYSIAKDAHDNTMFIDHNLASNMAALFAIILSFITAVLIGLFAINILLYLINYATYIVISRGYKHLTYSKLKSFVENIKDSSSGSNSSNQIQPPKKTINPIENLRYLYHNFLNLPAYSDFIVVTLGRIRANSQEKFLNLVFIQNPNSVDDYDIDKDMILFEDLQNLYEEYCFLNHLKEEEFTIDSISPKIEKFGFKIDHEKSTSMAYTCVLFKQNLGKRNIKFKATDLELDSLTLFMNYNVSITPCKEDKINVTEFSEKYEKFCAQYELAPDSITPQLMEAKFGISTEYVETILIKRKSTNENGKINNTPQENFTIIDRRNIEIHLNYLLYGKQNLTDDEVKKVKQTMYSEGGFQYEILNILIHYFFNILMVLPLIAIIILLNTSYEPYTIKNPIYLLDWNSFIYQPVILLTYLPYAMQIILLLFIILNFINFAIYLFTMKRPIETYFQEIKQSSWFRIIAFINWCVVIIFFFIYISYVGMCLTWILLGAIINPTYLLPYAAATFTFFSFVTMKYNELMNIIEEGTNNIMAIINRIYGQVFNKILAKIGTHIIKTEHKPLSNAVNIMQGNEFKRATKKLMEKNIIPKDAIQSLSNKITEASTANEDNDVPPILQKMEENPHFIQDHLKDLCTAIENNYINNIKLELQKKHLPDSLIDLFTSHCTKNQDNLKTNMLKFLSYLKDEGIFPSDLIIFVKVILDPNSSTTDTISLKFLAKLLVNVAIKSGGEESSKILGEKIIHTYFASKHLAQENRKGFYTEIKPIIKNNMAFEMLGEDHDLLTRLILVTIKFITQTSDKHSILNENMKILKKLTKILDIPENEDGILPTNAFYTKHYGNQFNANEIDFMIQDSNSVYSTYRQLINILKGNELIRDIPLVQIRNIYKEYDINYSHLDWKYWTEFTKSWSPYWNVPGTAAPVSISLFLNRNEVSNISPEIITIWITKLYKANYSETGSVLSDDYGQIVLDTMSLILSIPEDYIQKIMNYKKNEIDDDWRQILFFFLTIKYKNYFYTPPKLDINNEYFKTLLSKSKINATTLIGFLDWLLDASTTPNSQEFLNKIIEKLYIDNLSNESKEYLRIALILLTSSNPKICIYAFNKLNLEHERFFLVGKKFLSHQELKAEDYKKLFEIMELSPEDLQRFGYLVKDLEDIKDWALWKIRLLKILDKIYTQTKQDNLKMINSVFKINAYLNLDSESNEDLKNVISAIMSGDKKLLSIIKENTNFIKSLAIVISMKNLMPTANNYQFANSFEKKLLAYTNKFCLFMNFDYEFIQNILKLTLIENREAFESALKYFYENVTPQTKAFLRYSFSQIVAVQYDYNTLTKKFPSLFTWDKYHIGNADQTNIDSQIAIPSFWVHNIYSPNQSNSFNFTQFEELMTFFNESMKNSPIYNTYAISFDHSNLRTELEDLYKLNNGYLGYSKQLSNNLVQSLIDMISKDEKEIALSNFMTLFEDIQNPLCSALCIYSIFKGWGKTIINPYKKPLDCLTYQEVTSYQLGLNKYPKKNIHSEFFDIFDAILKNDIPSFVKASSRIIRTIKNQSYFDKHLYTSILSFLNGQLYDFTPIAINLQCKSEILEFCVFILYQLKNERTRKQAFTYLSTSIICENIFKKLNVNVDEFMCIIRIIFSEFNAQYTLIEALKIIDPKSAVNIVFLRGLLSLYNFETDPLDSYDVLAKKIDEEKSELDPLFELLKMDPNIGTLILSLRWGNFLMLETNAMEFDWAFGKIALINNKPNMSNASRALMHLTQGLCGIINSNVRYNDKVTAESTNSLNNAIHLFIKQFHIDKNWLNLALTISDPDNTSYHRLEYNDENLMKAIITYQFINIYDIQKDIMGLFDWQSAFRYYYNYDINGNVKNGTYLTVLESTHQYLRDLAIKLLDPDFESVKSIIQNHISKEAYIELENETKFARKWSEILLNTFIEIKENPNFQQWMSTKPDVTQDINNNFVTFINSLRKKNLKPKIIFDELLKKFDLCCMTVLIKACIPYLYEKLSRQKTNTESLLYTHSLHYLDLCVIGGLAHLRNLPNKTKNYSENVFKLFILMTNIERKLIFINGDVSKIFRRFFIMKLVGLSKGLIVLNCFELLLSNFLYDIFDFQDKTFYKYKSVDSTNQEQIEKYRNEAKEVMEFYYIKDENYLPVESEEEINLDVPTSFHLIATYHESEDQIDSWKILKTLINANSWSYVNTNLKKFEDMLTFSYPWLGARIDWPNMHYRQAILEEYLDWTEGTGSQLLAKLKSKGTNWEERDYAVKMKIFRKTKQPMLSWHSSDIFIQKVLIQSTYDDTNGLDEKLTDNKTGLTFKQIIGKMHDLEVELVNPNMTMLFNLVDYDYNYEKSTYAIENVNDFIFQLDDELKPSYQVTIGLISYLKNKQNHGSINELLPKLNFASDEKIMADIIIFLASNQRETHSFDWLKSAFDLTQNVMNFISTTLETPLYRNYNLAQKPQQLENNVPFSTCKSIKEISEAEDASVIALLHGLFNLNIDSWNELATKSVIGDVSLPMTKTKNYLHQIISMLNFNKLDEYLQSQESGILSDWTQIPNVFEFSTKNDITDSFICEIYSKITSNTMQISKKKVKDELPPEEKWKFFFCRSINRMLECPACQNDSELLKIFFTDYRKNIQYDYQWNDDTSKFTYAEISQVYAENLAKFERFVMNSPDSKLDQYILKQSKEAVQLAWLLYLKDDYTPNFNDKIKYASVILSSRVESNNCLSLIESPKTLSSIEELRIKHFILTFIGLIKGDMELILQSIDEKTPFFAVLSSLYMLLNWRNIVDFTCKANKSIIFNDNDDTKFEAIITEELKPNTLMIMLALRVMEAKIHDAKQILECKETKKWYKWQIQNSEKIKMKISLLEKHKTELKKLNRLIEYPRISIDTLRYKLAKMMFKQTINDHQDLEQKTWSKGQGYKTIPQADFKVKFDDHIRDLEYEKVYDSEIINNEEENNISLESLNDPKDFFFCVRSLFCMEDIFFISFNQFSAAPGLSGDWIYFNEYLILAEHLYSTTFTDQLLNGFIVDKNNEKVQLVCLNNLLKIQNIIRETIKNPSKIEEKDRFMFVSYLIQYILERLCHCLPNTNKKNSIQHKFIMNIISLLSIVSEYDFTSFFNKKCDSSKECQYCTIGNLSSISYHFSTMVSDCLMKNSIEELSLLLSSKKAMFESLLPLFLDLNYDNNTDTWEICQEKPKPSEEKIMEIPKEKEQLPQGSKNVESIAENEEKKEEIPKEKEQIQEDLAKIEPITEKIQYKYNKFIEFRTKLFEMLDLVVLDISQSISLEKRFMAILESIFKNLEDILKIVGDNEGNGKKADHEKISAFRKIIKGLYRLKYRDLSESHNLIEWVSNNDKEKAKAIIQFLEESACLIDLNAFKNLTNIPRTNEKSALFEQTQNLFKKIQSGNTDEADLFTLSSQHKGSIELSDFSVLCKRFGTPLSSHRIREIFANIKDTDVTPDDLQLDSKEFSQALNYLKDRELQNALSYLGISPADLYLELCHLIIILIVIFIFIFMGISAFTVGGAFSAVINSILPAVGALSLSGKNKKDDLKKIEKVEKEIMKQLSFMLSKTKIIPQTA